MDHEKKKQLIIKICCVVAAIVLRFYVSNVENPIIEYNIKNVPVTIVNEEKLKNSGLILIDEEGYNVNLTVKGPTNQVTKLNKQDFRIFADLEALALKKGENKILVSVDDYPDGINVLQNQQMLISIHLDSYIEREYKVTITIDGSTKDGYYAHETILEPEVVKVAGGEKELDKINKVLAYIDLAKADNDINKSVDLKIVDSADQTMDGLTMYPSKVKVKIPVNRTKSVPVVVEQIGEVDKDLEVKLIIPEPKTVKISGDEADLKIVESLKTEPIDMSKLKSSQKMTLKLVVPEGIVILDGASTVEVDISMEKILEKSIINVIGYENLEEGYEANLQFNTMNVTIKGVESLIENIDYRDISCKVDLKGFTEGTHIVPVNVKVPENIEIIESDIDSIKVEILKKSEVTDDVGENTPQGDGEENQETEGETETETLNGPIPGIDNIPRDNEKEDNKNNIGEL